jgi:hypothetical protein
VFVSVCFSYLTAPYLRIPLILSFFAQQERINALGSERLRALLDGCLFEPGAWQSIALSQKKLPDTIPFDRTYLSTCNGLLMNELTCSPQGMCASLKSILDLACDLDTGKWTPASSPIILYILRMQVRVEQYINYLAWHHEMDPASVAGSTWSSYVRGLQISPESYAVIKAHAIRTRRVLNEQAFPMLERWLQLATRANDIPTACILHAHLAYLFRNVSKDELTRPIVTTLIAAQVFLTTRYVYDLDSTPGQVEKRRSAKEEAKLKEAKARAKAKAAAANAPASNTDAAMMEDVNAELDTEEGELGIPETEIFMLFQQKRYMVLRWLERDPHEGNEVMEAVIRICTFTGGREKPAVAKPPPPPPAMLLLQPGDEEKKAALVENKPSVVIGAALAGESAELVVRAWRSMDGRNCKGRYIPDMSRAARHRQSSQKPGRGGSAVTASNTIVGADAVGQGTMVIKRGSGIPSHPTSGSARNSRQGSPALSRGGSPSRSGGGTPTGARTPRGTQTIVTSHTIAQAAAEKAKEYKTYEDYLRYGVNPKNDTELNVQLGDLTLKANRLQVLEPHIQQMDDFQTLFGADSTQRTPLQSAEVKNTTNRSWVRLVGRRHDLMYWNADERKTPSNFEREYRADRMSGGENWIVKSFEHVRSKYLKGVQFFLPRSEYSSTATVAILSGFDGATQLKEVVVFRKPSVCHIYNVLEHGRRFYRSLIYSSDAQFCLQDLPPHLTIRPDPLNKNNMLAHYESGNPLIKEDPAPSLVITRSLSALLGTQTFMPERFLRGLMPSCLLDDYMFYQSENDQLTGYLKKESPTGDNAVIRVQLAGNTAKITRTRHEDKMPGESASDLVLLNLMYAPEGSSLSAISELLLRMENLSHILVWTNTKVVKSKDECNIDLVELPRLRLSFYSQTDTVGSGDTSRPITRLYSNEHAGLFISTYHDDPAITSLMEGIPHALLLENNLQEFFMLVPAGAKPTRPKLKASLFSVPIVSDRRNEEWLANLDTVRHYLYPIHLSRTFVVSHTLSSTLYLMYMRFLDRQYERAFRLTDSCVTDTPLSGEEAQIWKLFGESRDAHPDAQAFRLKLSIVTQGTTLKCEWDILECYTAYLQRYSHVSASCRLTVAEELTLLYECDTEQFDLQVRNRAMFLQAVDEKKWGQAFSVTVPARPTLEGEYDLALDKSCMETLAYENPFVTTSYTRPDEKDGAAAMSLMNRWINQGFRLSGSNNNLGFVSLLLIHAPLVNVYAFHSSLLSMYLCLCICVVIFLRVDDE